MDVPQEPRPTVDELKATLAKAGTPADRLAALLALGDELRSTAPFDAEPFVSEALELAREVADRSGEAAALARLAEITSRKGERTGALALAEQALDVARSAGCRREEAVALSLLGIHHSGAGNYEQAREFYRQCLVVSQEIGHTVGIQATLNQLGNLAMFQGNREEALRYYQELVDVNEQVGDDLGRAAMHSNIGILLMEMGRWEDAVENLYRAIGVCERRGFQHVLYNALNTLGELFLKRDKIDRAIDTLEVVTEAGRRRATDPAVLRDALCNLGRAYLRRGESARAGMLFQDAMKLCQESGDRREQAVLCWSMAEHALAERRLDDAARLLEQALGLARELRLRPQEAEALRVQALTYAAADDPDQAIASFEAALEALTGSEDSFELARLRMQYGRFLVELGDKTGTDHLKAAAKTFRRLAVVAEAEDVSRLIFRLEMRADRDMALLQAISGLSALALSPPQFIEQTLGLLCEGLRFDRGALLMNGRPVVAHGRVNTGAGMELAARGELTGNPAALCLPLRARGKVIGSMYLERTAAGPTDHNPVVIDTLANLLTVTVQRLADSLVRAAASDQVIEGLEFRGFVGTHPVLRDLLTGLARVAAGDEPVLLVGEPGTGRQALARALHDSGTRAGEPFVVVGCADVPESLLAAELFGSSVGKLAAAAHGTVYFEEVGSLGLALQSKLLHLLGQPATHVRVAAGTSRDLPGLVRQGFFSAELYRKLSKNRFLIPPLRERAADIPGLVRYFINESNQEFGRQVVDVATDVVKALSEYDWPGNLSELQRVIERAVLLAPEPVLRLHDIPSGLRPGSATAEPGN
ncbi:tetratricopeptide repeat protein [candidate division WOR-3 bacterium]|nr:tetratricopeptide repeat protein [candidate division WOR-3 bacterium]